MRGKGNENGVPTKDAKYMKKIVVLVVGMVLLAGSVTAGYFTAPEDIQVPVMLSGGEVIMQPYFVAAGGECLAVVEDEDAAEKVVDMVKDEYKSSYTVHVEIEEEPVIENMELENGSEKPEILTVKQASEQILEEELLTVKTTDVVEEDKAVAYEIIEKKSDRLNLGEQEIEQQGEEGMTHVTKEVVKSNGVVVSENVIEEEAVKESVPEIVVSGTAGMLCPLDEIRVTSTFGERWGRQHKGLDMGAPEGTEIYAAKDGVVTCAEYKDSFGNLVIIDHGGELESYYAHCSSLDVLPGQQVTAGQKIAAVGSTGNSTGPHLHFEVRTGGVPQDPEEWITF